MRRRRWSPEKRLAMAHMLAFLLTVVPLLFILRHLHAQVKFGGSNSEFSDLMYTIDKCTSTLAAKNSTIKQMQISIQQARKAYHMNHHDCENKLKDAHHRLHTAVDIQKEASRNSILQMQEAMADLSKRHAKEVNELKARIAKQESFVGH
jgi:hypothetical protein